MDSSQIKGNGKGFTKLWCFLQHLESLAQTNSQALKRAELIGWAKCMDAKYPIDLAINLPCFDPFKSFKPRFPKGDT